MATDVSGEAGKWKAAGAERTLTWTASPDLNERKYVPATPWNWPPVPESESVFMTPYVMLHVEGSLSGDEEME